MIDNDDLLYRVDRHYLGPTGYPLPVRIRYTAGIIGMVAFVVVFVIGRGILHVPLGYKSLLLMAGITFLITQKIAKFVTPDRPLRSVFKAALNDLIAPRPPKHGKPVFIVLPRRSTAGALASVSAHLDGEDHR